MAETWMGDGGRPKTQKPRRGLPVGIQSQVNRLFAQKIQSFHSALGLPYRVAMAKNESMRMGVAGGEPQKNKWHQKGTDGRTSRGQESGNDLETEQLVSGADGRPAGLSIGGRMMCQNAFAQGVQQNRARL